MPSKWKYWIMVLFMAVFVLSACQPLTTPTPVATAVPSGRSLEGTYYFLAGNNADPFYKPGVKGFKDAGDLVGMKTAFVGPMDLNVAEQMKTFEQLVNAPDTAGIFWYPMDFVQGEVYIKEAKEKGIPIVIGAADSPNKTRDAFIGVNDQIFGTAAGAWAAELTNCQGKVGAIALVQANTDARIAAYYDYLKQMCPDMKFADRISHDGSPASATTALDAYLAANPDLSLIYFADGSGGQQGQNWLDKQAQGVKTMLLVTDTTDLALQGVKDGAFVGVLGQDTYTEEYWGVMLLDAINKGVPVPDTLYLAANRVDKGNVDAFIARMAELNK
jgi:ABC-type sugar transport system substrate-binding protein